MQQGSIQQMNALCLGDDSHHSPHPAASSDRQAPTSEKKIPSRAPVRGVSRQWSNCSLCSIDSFDMDEQLPIPGRESHTSDMQVFGWHFTRLMNLGRIEGDPPLNHHFWKFIQKILETATEAGYSELLNPDDAAPKGPNDNAAFLNKIRSTNVINPIHPKVLASESGLPLETVLTELLYATQTQLVTMRWTPSCDICHGQKKIQNKLNNRINRNSRKGSRGRRHSSNKDLHRCEYSNAIDCLKKMHVAFVLHVDIFHALAESFRLESMEKALRDDELFCVVPGTFTGSGFRYSLGCGGSQEVRPALEAGKYRMHCPLAMTKNYLTVVRDATDADEPVAVSIHVSDLVFKGGERKNLTVPHGRIHLDVFTDTQAFFILWIQKIRNQPQPQQPSLQDCRQDDGDGGDDDGGGGGGGGGGGDEEEDEDDDEDDDDPPDVPYLTAQQLMEHSTYQHLFEATEVEAYHFSNAVKKMVLIEKS